MATARQFSPSSLFYPPFSFSIHPKLHLPLTPFTSSPDEPAGAALGLAFGLEVGGVLVADADQAAHAVGDVRVAAVDGEDVEDDDVALPGRDGDGPVQLVRLERQ